jgi:hypothetical protein
MSYRRFCFAGVALLFVPGVVESCGPFLEFAQFTTYHTTFPDEFASGRFGVLRPHYWRADLLVAYRILSGVLVSKGETPGPLSEGYPPSDRMMPWLDARNKLKGVPVLQEIDADKKVRGSGFEVYPNCLSGAFETAADTLRKRIAEWGASSRQVSEWVRGQDEVFQNCSAGPAIPPRIPWADKLLAADREYQIAASEFYAEQYDKAEADFDRIALDRSSPWHEIAPYVAARVCIRQGTIGQNEDKLRQAAERLRTITDDPARGPLRTPAQELLNFVQARLDPDKRLVDLGNELMRPRQGVQLQRVITDYTKIWDAMEMSGHAPSTGNSEVTDWIATFQKGGGTVGKWRAKTTIPWLLAALVWAETEKAGASDVKDLIEAAHAVKPDSPGYATAMYYGILTQIRQGESDAARQWADEALSRKEPEQVANLLRAERFSLARNWAEFLRFAPRTPVASSGDAMDWPLDPANAKQRRPALDADASNSLNTTVPLRLWADAAENKLLPRNLQAEIAQAGWVRAVILRDQSSARRLAERLSELEPEFNAGMRGYLAEQDSAAANFFAVFLMLHTPGFEPQVRTGWGRATAPLKSDMLRDNWWSVTNPPKTNPETSAHQALLDLYPNGRFGPEGFLSADQREAGTTEWAQVKERAGNSVDYLCSETIAWAQGHPQDSRVPEALYLAVQATHYGPADGSSSAWSKRVFMLLHSGYPSSEWTKKTKYWY